MLRAVSAQVSTFYAHTPCLWPRREWLSSPINGRGDYIAVCKSSPLPLVGEGSGERVAAPDFSLERVGDRSKPQHVVR